MNVVGITDVGKIREHNEDSIFISSENISSFPNLFIVADGMGGHNAGEIASSKAIEYFLEYANSVTFPADDIMDQLIAGVNTANKFVFEKSKAVNEYKGMGTTFTACVYDDKVKKLYIAHVGDTRLYGYTDTLEQYTMDHTYVAMMVKMGKITKDQAETHPYRNWLTRSVGTDVYVQIDGYTKITTEPLLLLLCSDGLSNMVTEEKIEEIIKNNTDINKMCQELIDEANSNGGNDNVSVIIVEVGGDNSET